MASVKKKPDEAATELAEAIPEVLVPADPLPAASESAPAPPASLALTELPPPPAADAITGVLPATNQSATAPAVTVTKTKAAPSPAKTGRRYRVWSQGTLERDNVTYKPGELLELPPAVGDAIPCLLPADD